MATFLASNGPSYCYLIATETKLREGSVWRALQILKKREMVELLPADESLPGHAGRRKPFALTDSGWLRLPDLEGLEQRLPEAVMRERESRLRAMFEELSPSSI